MTEDGLDEKNHVCPFMDERRYNGDLNGGNGFTLKEIVLKTQNDLNRLNDKIDEKLEKVEHRVSLLERWRSAIVAVYGTCIALLTAWKAIWR